MIYDTYNARKCNFTIVSKRSTLVFPKRVLPNLHSHGTLYLITALELITASGMGPGVVSMSLGGSTSSAQDTAVANAVAAGYVVSVAAGNDNSNACNYSPARAPEVGL